MTQPEADKLLIKPDDTMEEINGSCYELLRAVLAEATRNGIKANSIVINKNMVRVPESFGQWPEMICGLHCFFTADELPDGYAFSVQHAPGKKITNGDHIRSMTDEELIAMLGTNTLCDWIQDNDAGFCDNHGSCDGCLAEWLRKPYEEDSD